MTTLEKLEEEKEQAIEKILDNMHDLPPAWRVDLIQRMQAYHDKLVRESVITYADKAETTPGT